jgi:transposase
MRPKGSAAELEARRRLAVALLQDGKSNTEVARLVGADLSSVKRWKRAVVAGGPNVLAAKPIPGRTPKLSAEQRQELARIVRDGPLAAGFRTNLWTCRRVAEVIQQRFGITYHPDHVGKMLHALGFTPQKPQRLANERDEVAIQQWRKRVWPRIKKKGVSGKLPLCFLMKRASCCSR